MFVLSVVVDWFGGCDKYLFVYGVCWCLWLVFVGLVGLNVGLRVGYLR